MKYDYRDAIRDDVLEYIKNEIDLQEFDTPDELEDKLYDELWLDDSVTGNASGSYTFNTYEAEDNIAHNLDLLAEAYDAFGCDFDTLLRDGAEGADVTIRCYLLGECIAAALEVASQAETWIEIVYGKKNFEKFIERTYDTNLDFYCNKKTEQFLQTQGLQLPNGMKTVLSNSNYSGVISKSQETKKGNSLVAEMTRAKRNRR